MVAGQGGAPPGVSGAVTWPNSSFVLSRLGLMVGVNGLIPNYLRFVGYLRWDVHMDGRSPTASERKRR